MRRAIQISSKESCNWRKPSNDAKGGRWANSFCGATIHEVNNPLEAITNLVYLTRSQKNDPALVSQNVEVVEQQLAILSKITSQALAFHRTQAEAQPCDLIAIAELALQLHAGRIERRRVRIETRFQRPAMTRAFETEILQGALESHFERSGHASTRQWQNFSPRENLCTIRTHYDLGQRQWYTSSRGSCLSLI